MVEQTGPCDCCKTPGALEVTFSFATRHIDVRLCKVCFDQDNQYAIRYEELRSDPSVNALHVRCHEHDVPLSVPPGVT